MNESETWGFCCAMFLLGSTFTQPCVQYFFSDAQAVRGDFQQLILIDEFQCLLETQYTRRSQLQRLIGRRGSRIGEMFCLTHVEFDIFSLAILADDHSGVYLLAGTDEECSAVLG